MLKKSSVSFTLGLASIVLFMSSCSIMNSEFSKRRYTRFKVRHEQNEIAVNDLQTKPAVTAVTEPELVNVKEETKSASLNTSAPELKKTDAKKANTFSSLKNENSELKSSNLSFAKSFVKQYSQFHKAAKHSDRPNTNTLLLILLCLFLPFIAVLVERGICTEFWITCLLCLLFWIPGVIYAFIVCFGGGGSGRSATR